jgi:rSAM/selenodomain-associated transferase 2
MKPTLSVVIPTLNEANKIGSVLDFLDGISAVEVIVADGGSSDDTIATITKYPSVTVVHSAPGRGVQLNQGASAAKGEILWFLHADSTVPEGWEKAIREALSSANVVAGCFRLSFDYDHWLLSVFSFCSRWNHPLVTYGDQGYFLKRAVFERIGGFRDFPILEDLEIQCRLRRLGMWKKLDLFLTTSARRFKVQGILRQQLKNIGIVALFLAGASPFWLRRFYRPQFQLKPEDQSLSLKPTALNESVRSKGRFTRFPFSWSSWKASFSVMVGILSFKPRAR